MTRYIYDEKTAPSAPICTFEDGIDGIPTKSLVVTIPPTLSGVSSVTENRNGGNFIELYTRSSHNGVDYSINADGSLHRYGTASGNSFNNGNATNYNNCPYKFHAGTYTLSVDGNINNNTFVALGIFLKSGASFTSQGVTGVGSVTFTVSEDFGAWYYCKLNNGVTVNDDVYIWLYGGSTAHDYEPYIAPTTYTANLGRTIYGGTPDIVNGEGTSSYGKVDLGTLAWQYDSANTRFFTIGLTGVIKRGTSGWITDLAIDSPYTVASGTANDKTVSEYASTGYVYIKDTDYTDPATFKASLSGKYLVYPLATPTDFTFTGQEINTRLGYNAFWSDSGNTEVTYYIQIPVEEKYIIGGEILSDIADAIREKKETASPILTEDMADEIRSIEMGGSDLLDLASQTTFDFTDDTYKTSALTIPDRMFNNNQRIRTVNISGIKTVESYAFIQCKATSLSFPDVETIGYQAFFQCRGASDVPLSIPNVVTIGEEAFKEAYVCGESPSYRFLDISKCVSIGNNAFRSTRINGFKMDSVETLGNMPWYGSWFSMTTVVFPKLKTAHDQMCRGMNFTNLVIGPDWQSCGGGFAGYDMDWRNKYVYVYAVVPPTMGGDFSLWKPPVAFYVPADSVDAYKAAPYWSQYASIILPLPSDHLTIDTWL